LTKELCLRMLFVSTIDRLEGRYDLIVKIDADTEDNLREVISKDIHKIQGVLMPHCH
jgi:DNA-binding Lrp family transcriptional regulator